tara:strand:- start:814 stop:1200 length:387 start_codon:yes stop_codon:yes gene_type:complete
MESKKIIELKLIENRKKTKKKLLYNLESLKYELYDVIDTIIDYDFSYINSDVSTDYIKKQLLEYLKLYINLNRNIKNINGNNKIIHGVIKDLINNVVYRCEHMKDETIIKHINEIKKEKLEIDIVTMI